MVGTALLRKICKEIKKVIDELKKNNKKISDGFYFNPNLIYYENICNRNRTDVKTIASSIITESLQADYWKPIQAGDLDNSDSHKIQRYISNDKTTNSYKLTRQLVHTMQQKLTT
jgi:hypothetical protein